MKTFLVVLLTGLLAFVVWFVYGLDQWMGVVAFTYRYLLFCVMAALLFYGVWATSIKKQQAIWVGVVVFGVLAANFVLPAPSERILRAAWLRIPVGTPADAIERVVTEAYDGSGFVLPRITEEENRIHVSLMSQQAGNCTAIIFKTRDGVVVESEYSPD